MAAPSTSSVLEMLSRYESRNVTYLDPEGGWPIVWERARGHFVWDPEGRKYLDLTAAFGVAATGHANPRVVRAGQRQMSRLLHAMGDVHPHPLKGLLARELSCLTFERWDELAQGSFPRERPWSKMPNVGKTIFCNSGFEAVEAALKTALLATGRAGIIAFRGGYHGLGYGALNATERDHFRRPFLAQLAQFGQFFPFPDNGEQTRQLEQELRHTLGTGRVGAVLVEARSNAGRHPRGAGRFLADVAQGELRFQNHPCF